MHPPIQRRNRPKKRRSGVQLGSDGMGTTDIPVETLAHLNENQIYLLTGPSKQPFLCRVCGCHFSSVGSSLHHANQPEHTANLQAAHITPVLLHLPPVCEAHRSALNRELTSASQGVLINATELKRRQQFADHLICWLEHRIQNLRLARVGSTWTGIALIDSDVNLDVSYRTTKSGNENPHEARFIVSKNTFTTTVESGGTAQRSPGLGYLLMHLFNELKSHAHTKPPNSDMVTAGDSSRTKQAVDQSLQSPNKGKNVIPEIYS
ncbi:unnamed protein product [Echinostoma caproni]|uniref:RNA uridylyltransferase n=1 Tax=Echinostoma caproni TaxID=27848 RepID=A0A183B798_9TREM|nr:unnamed protein product [Echinostoma caproni]